MYICMYMYIYIYVLMISNCLYTIHDLCVLNIGLRSPYLYGGPASHPALINLRSMETAGEIRISLQFLNHYQHEVKSLVAGHTPTLIST